MIDCIPDTSGKKCVVCAWIPRDSRSFPHHNCSKAPENIAARRKVLDDQLTAFHTRCTEAGLNVRPLAEAMEIVDRHCAACDQFTGDGCRLLIDCGQREHWQAIYGVPTSYLPKLAGLSRPCERWATRRQ